MWLNTSATALDIHPEPSRRVAWLLWGVHGLAVAGLVAVSPWLGGLSLPVAGWSLVRHLRSAGWLGGGIPVARLRVLPDGVWRILDAQGRWLQVQIDPGSFCAGGWCVLRMQSLRGCHVLALAPDSAPPDDLRRLRRQLLALDADSLAPGGAFAGRRWRVDILRRRNMPDTSTMPTDQERLEALLSEDPDHVYSDEELDAIEAIDAEMALRLDRVQTLARRRAEAVVADGPVDEAGVREAVEEARRILMQDGGDIEFVALEDRIVRVRLKGACVGCPRSTLDLRNVVERLIRSKEPGVEKVVNEF
jgi:toxin CptA